MINGTQLITALGAEALSRAEVIAKQADIIAALSIDVLQGTPTAFDYGRQLGGLAQMVERSLSMREVPGSIPGSSTALSFFFSIFAILLIFFLNFATLVMHFSLFFPHRHTRQQTSLRATGSCSQTESPAALQCTSFKN